MRYGQSSCTASRARKLPFEDIQVACLRFFVVKTLVSSLSGSKAAGWQEE